MKGLVVSVLIALLVFGCTQQYAAPNAPQAPATTPAANSGLQAPPAAQASKATVGISGFAFNPASIEIAKGTTVTWTNKDSVPHSVTSDNGAFDTGIFQSGGEGSYTFNAPGTYAYHCSVHPSMKGTVVVK
ncbi:Halocyanin [Candidatus Anstonella stagnisolia]|nr:Halocyanin [Candidatus Anstonella stagnisolia]